MSNNSQQDLINHYMHDMSDSDFSAIFLTMFESYVTSISEKYKVVISLNVKTIDDFSSLAFDKTKEILSNYIKLRTTDLQYCFADRHKISACVVLALFSLEEEGIITVNDSTNATELSCGIVSIMCGMHFMTVNLEALVLLIVQGYIPDNSSFVQYIKKWGTVALSGEKVDSKLLDKHIPKINKMPNLTQEFNVEYGNNYLFYLVNYVKYVLFDELNSGNPCGAVMKLADIMYHIEIFNVSQCQSGLRVIYSNNGQY